MKSIVYEEMARLEESNWFFRGRHAYVSQLLKALLPKKRLRILDVGCGTGGMSVVLTKFGAVTGIEEHPWALRASKKRGIRAMKGNANRLPWKKPTFDLITFFDVLYHKGIHEDQAISQANRVLKKGGYLVITDCAHQWLFSKHDEMVEGRVRYSKNDLVQLVTRHGFRVERVTYLFFLTFPLFVLQRIITKATGRYIPLSTTPEVANRFLSFLLSIDRYLLSHMNLPMGSTIFVFARKQ